MKIWPIFILVHYEDAVTYQSRHRNNEPALFNENRFNEALIPDLNNSIDNITGESSQSEDEQSENNDQQSASQDEQTANEDDQPENQAIAESLENDNGDGQLENSLDENQNADTHENGNQIADTHEIDQTGYGNLFTAQQEEEIDDSVHENDNLDRLYIDTAQFEVKQEHLDLVENHDDNTNDIERLLGDGNSSAQTSIETETIQEEELDDDMFILIGRSGIPKPKGMRFKLVKRENDLFSGDISFDITVSVTIQIQKSVKNFDFQFQFIFI